MPPRSRPLTDTDRATWADYVRHVQLLAGRSQPADLPPQAPAAAQKVAPTPQQHGPVALAPRRMPTPALVTGLHPAGLDKSSWGRFSGGKLPAARTLDLHGKTAQAAYVALERFLHAAHADRLRCVEVITGRGSGEQGGVIRRELPFWLNQPNLRPLVLAAAHPHAKNAGSTRLLLRRIRP
jgi:DNA-nicking Smr family endonuclease